MKKLICLIITFLFCVTMVSFADTQVENRIRTVQNTDETVDVNAFNNNWQSAVNSSLPEGLSPIEQMFNGKENAASGTVLKQAGYDMFNGTAASGGTSGGKFDSSYKLSIGEKVNVYLYGDSVDVIALSGSNLLNSSAKTEIDSKGNLFVQGIGLFPAENKTISEVESQVNAAAQSKYQNLKVRLTIAQGQEFAVFVYGQVNRPGRVAVGNNSSIFDALNAAGGVKKTGTLRNISYTSQGKNIN